MIGLLCAAFNILLVFQGIRCVDQLIIPIYCEDSASKQFENSNHVGNTQKGTCECTSDGVERVWATAIKALYNEEVISKIVNLSSQHLFWRYVFFHSKLMVVDFAKCYLNKKVQFWINFESKQKEESRAQSADSSKACRKSNYVKLRIRLSERA